MYKYLKRIICIFFILLFSFIVFGSTLHIAFKPKYYVILNIDQGKYILDLCTRPVPSKNIKFWKVTKNDIKKLEGRFLKISSVTSKKWITPYKINDLTVYAYQNIGVIFNNRKYIYINAFPLTSESDLNERFHDWEREFVDVCDGGVDYWGILFDVQILKFSHLYLNGE